MQLRWGICSAAKICNDFCVALKTLPGNLNFTIIRELSANIQWQKSYLAENHKIQAVAARSKDSAQ